MDTVISFATTDAHEIATIDGRLLLTIREACRALGRSRSSIYRDLEDGLYEVVYMDSRPRITARSILRRAGLLTEPAGNTPPSEDEPVRPRRRLSAKPPRGHAA
jgi:hypothetical protein